ncbi:hypothetical protein [Asticcacaulis sp. 201]|uniref:HD domain-containing protein n=1 Tax=Asticcacaulis sp. 201 TaxID=3028787 RepID=UPI0029162A14|nr:hypothetical protein [Asticcacaulis sp. 201]MDV6331380.1 hypothetical protein [Asticcacaulis sp. 201]
MTLKDRWHDLARALGVGEAEGAVVWQRLSGVYGEPHRHYHTLTHIDAVIHDLDRLAQAFVAPDEAALALFFHDVVYDPARSDNEDRSAEYLRDTLPELDTTHAQSMIRATRHHRGDADPDTNLLLDIDMAILAADWPDYLAYARGVYREYLPVYGHDAYAAGRVALFLEPTLARTHLFLTDAFAAGETTARENLNREIALWRDGGFATYSNGAITPAP